MQNVVIYPGAILELQTTLRDLKKKKIFLVSGKESFERCGAKDKLKWLFATYDVIHFNNFQTNPDSNDVIKGIQLFNHEKCEIIVSVGGGSVIDMAKLINYYNKSEIKTLEKFNIKIINPKLVRHICLPTTAGSGSEATHFAVMYIGEIKYSIADPTLIPDVAIIDPELHYSQTSYQKAVSGVDALAQSIESLWSNNSNKESRALSELALNIIWKNLPNVVHKCDKLSHLMLAVGANLAGKAINLAKTTAPHALSYGFTKYVGLPHGHAVAITLPYFISLHSKVTDKNCIDKRGTHHILKQLDKVSKITNTDLYSLSNAISLYISDLGINLNYNQLGITRDIFLKVLDCINYDRLSNNPVIVDIQELNNLF